MRIDLEGAKNFLSAKDDDLSYNAISKKTGYSVAELRDMYDEILKNGELADRKHSYTKFKHNGYICRIDPITFEVKEYKRLSELTEDGYTTVNVIAACNTPCSVSRDYMWRFSDDIDLEDVQGSMLDSAPTMFTPIIGTNLRTKKQTHFKTIFYAEKAGYSRRGIKRVLDGICKKNKNMIWTFET